LLKKGARSVETGPPSFFGSNRFKALVGAEVVESPPDLWLGPAEWFLGLPVGVETEKHRQAGPADWLRAEVEWFPR